MIHLIKYRNGIFTDISILIDNNDNNIFATFISYSYMMEYLNKVTLNFKHISDEHIINWLKLNYLIIKPITNYKILKSYNNFEHFINEHFEELL